MAKQSLQAIFDTYWKLWVKCDWYARGEYFTLQRNKRDHNWELWFSEIDPEWKTTRKRLVLDNYTEIREKLEQLIEELHEEGIE